MINLHERMLPTSAGVGSATSCFPVGRRIQLSHRGRLLLSTMMLGLELAKFYTQDCAWGVAHSIHICTKKNIVPSPSCACGEFESCYHFFLRCPRYANVRNTYPSGYLHTHSVQELLHGKVTATDEDNETMFCHVQEFIFVETIPMI